jgi:hypothetical protein
MSLDIYVFPSNRIDNVRIGVENGIWAVPAHSETMHRQYAKKASSMPVGSHGVFYCSDIKALTVPFIVLSPVDEDAVVRDVWDGEFVLPFHICALGDGWHYIEKDSIDRALPSLRNSNRTWHKTLRFRPNLAFLPTCLSACDWEILVQRLAPIDRRERSYQFAVSS